MAARVVVVADNPSLSLGLTGQDFDVTALHPDELSGLADGPNSPDVVVVGVESPATAAEVIGACHHSHSGVPVLLVASDAPGWNSVRQLDGGDIEVLMLPVSRLSLVNAIQRTVHGLSSPSSSAAHSATAPDVSPAAAETHQRIVAVRSTSGLRARLAQRPADAAATTAGAPERQLEAPPPDADDHVLTSQQHRTSPREQSAEWSQLRDGAVAEVERGVRPQPSAALDLVRTLLAHVDELVDVRDAANALVEEAATLADASYGAVLLPDNGVWQVCGAVGVRPLEWRYVVEADSWLATTVIEGNRGVIIEDSDIARQRLGGAPLAHHAFLLAAPIPGAHGLAIFARDSGTFHEDQLSAVATACADAGALLNGALQVRTLARALGDFRGLDS